MMTVTEAAARAINSLVTENQMPDTAGLRIAPQSQGTRSEGIGLSIAVAPADSDTVLESHGAKVFLASTVVFDLHEQQLDVEGGDGGEQLRFFVERRPREGQGEHRPGGPAWAKEWGSDQHAEGKLGDDQNSAT